MRKKSFEMHILWQPAFKSTLKQKNLRKSSRISQVSPLPPSAKGVPSLNSLFSIPYGNKRIQRACFKELFQLLITVFRAG